MNPLVLATLLLAVSLMGRVPPARAGHEFPFYPSYYPQEITLETIAPAVAATRLTDGTLHAYAGADPYPGRPVPANVTPVESLGAYVVVTPNPAAPFFADRGRRCAVARAASDALLSGPGTFRRHPWAVTPLHGDFLAHADLAAREASDRKPAPAAPLRVRAVDLLAERAVPPAWRQAGPDWDAAVETVEVAELWATAALGPNGWTGTAWAPWARDGWRHAVALQAATVSDPAARQAVETMVRRLTAGEYAGPVARLDLERGVVTRLAEGCERLVAGYTVRREHVYTEYSGGVENVAADAQAGLASAIFARTVKLKDFPWNGWLTVGTPEPPRAAWNPVAGFSDRAGRLLWFAVGDPALLPDPRATGWVENRVLVAAVEAPPGGVAVPPDALLPAPGSGLLHRVASGARAAARVEYRVLASRFHDGTQMAVADVLHAFGFAARVAEPAVAEATRGTRERLRGLRPLRVDTAVLAFGEDKLTYEVPVIEVYVDQRADDPRRIAAIAPPWTTVPWHVLALMEDAAARGLAAFSADEARRRGIAWLDLVRDAALVPALAARADELARQGFVPFGLAGLVTAEEARARWTALGAFHRTHGHLLVTNGPYLLEKWSPSGAVLRVFRDLSYPRGLGAFNLYAAPLRAYAAEAEVRGGQLMVRAEVEKIERFGREQRVVRERFTRRVSEQDKRSLPVLHWVLVAPGGGVAGAGAADPEPGGDAFRVALPLAGGVGAHTLLIALSLDENLVDLPVKVLVWTP
jgi:hypothetical protein